MKVMMLTAGEGTRLRPHTNSLPKPAISFLNVPLYLHALRFLEEIKLSQVIFNTFHLSDKLKATISQYSYPFSYQFSDESVLLGSGGGLGFARKFFENENEFIVMNGDELILPEKMEQLKQAIEFHKKNKNIATLLVTEHAEVGKKFGGVWVDSANQILGFGKQQVQNSTKGFHYIGVGIFSKEIFKFIPEGESNILYDNLMASFTAGFKASVFPLSCHWYETGNESDFKQASWQCLDEINKNTSQGQFLLQTLKSYSPESAFLKTEKAKILFHNKAQIDPGQVISYGVFDQNVRIISEVKVEKVICGKDVFIKENVFDKMF